MSYRECDKTVGDSNALGAKTLPSELRSETREAFRAWLDASKAWSTLRQAVEANADNPTVRQELEESEQRLNAAAEAFTRAQQRLSDFPSLRCFSWGDADKLRRKAFHLVPAREPRCAS